MDFIIVLSVVWCCLFTMGCISVALDEVLPGIPSAVWRTLWSYQIKITVEPRPIMTAVTAEVIWEEEDEIDYEWDLDLESTELMNVVNPLIEQMKQTPESMLDRVFMGKSVAFTVDEVINQAIKQTHFKRSHTLMADCDYSLDSEDNYVQSSMQQTATWVDGLKMAVLKDRGERAMFLSL